MSEATIGRHSRISTQGWLTIDDHSGPTNMDEEHSTLNSSSSSSNGHSTNVGTTNANMTTLNDRKKEFRIIAFILTPAIVTTFVFLGMYWNEEANCNAPLRSWCLIEAFRLVISITLSWVLQRDVDRTPAMIAQLDQIGRFVSMFSFCWFILGHIWLVQGAEQCRETSPHLFHLTAALVILQYTLMLLPLIVLILLTPFICLCLPCLIQGFLFFNRSQVKGASKKEINKLPTTKFSATEFMEHGYSDQCAICIADFEHGEVVRVLRCNHVFHKDCVDSWLTLNGTCPICRANIKTVPSPRPASTSTSSSSNTSLAIATPPDLIEGNIGNNSNSNNNNNISMRENSSTTVESTASESIISQDNIAIEEEDGGPTVEEERVAAESMIWRRMAALRNSLFRRSRSTSNLVALQRHGSSANTATSTTNNHGLSVDSISGSNNNRGHANNNSTSFSIEMV